MEKDLQHTPLIEIAKEMETLQDKIDLLIMKYEIYRQEVLRRFPPFEQNIISYEKKTPEMRIKVR